MRFIPFIATILHLSLVHAAIIPASTTVSHGFPYTNQSHIEETLHSLNGYEASTKGVATLKTFRPWPAAPLNFRSTTQPSWFLRVNSYDGPQLNFRQMHAMIDLCYKAQVTLKRVDPDTRMQEKSYIFRATQREPHDLTQEDVEVIFFNSAEEPGAGYKAVDMYMALDIMLGRMLPQHLPEFSRTVIHYADMELRNGSILKFRKVKIQRKTNDRTSAVATA